MIHSEIINPCR